MLPKIGKEFDKMGEVIGGAISKAVSGDLEGFLLIGELIGKTIKDGVKIGIREGGASASSVILRGLSKTPGLVGIAGSKFLNNAADTINYGNEGQRNQSMRRLQQNLREGYQNIQAATIRTEGVGGTMWRPVRADESSPFVDAQGNRIIQLLEENNKLLTPQPGT